MTSVAYSTTSQKENSIFTNNMKIPDRIEFVKEEVLGSGHIDEETKPWKKPKLQYFNAAATNIDKDFDSTGFSGKWVTPCSFPLEWKRIFRTGKGLRNLGNTCFLNASLQALLHCPPFAEALLQRKLSSEAKCTSNNGFCSLCAMENVAHQVLSNTQQHSPSNSYSPVELVRNLRVLSRNFTPGRQADAHEWIRFLLEDMNRTILGLSRGKICKERQKEIHTFIHEIFGGCYQSQVICNVCDKMSETSEPFLDISIDIERASTVKAALNNFISTEKLCGSNRYHCSYCKQKVDASKKFVFCRAPNVLILHLKRFRMNRKENKWLAYEEILDFTNYMARKDDHDRIRYRLCAVIVHEGQHLHGGHYYAYVRNSNDIWYLKDDECSRQVGIQSVLNQRGYLLFYCRIAEPMKKSITSSLSSNVMNKTSSQPLPKEIYPKIRMEKRRYDISVEYGQTLLLRCKRIQGNIGILLGHALKLGFYSQLTKQKSSIEKKNNVNSTNTLQLQHETSNNTNKNTQWITEENKNDYYRKLNGRNKSICHPFSVGIWDSESLLSSKKEKLLEQNTLCVGKKRDWWDREYDKGREKKRKKKNKN
eukprot:jgi/Galph1/3465/GphlegSOOS_G2158.1